MACHRTILFFNGGLPRGAPCFARGFGLRDEKQAVIVKSLPADETIPADIVLPHEGISVMEPA